MRIEFSDFSNFYHERFERFDLLRERERDDQSRDDLDFLNVETSFLVFDRDRDRDRDFDRE